MILASAILSKYTHVTDRRQTDIRHIMTIADIAMELQHLAEMCNSNSILSCLVLIRAAKRLKILIALNLAIKNFRKKKHEMYINYQPQHMSFCSREKQSYLKRSVQLRSSLQLLQDQPVV